MKTLLPQNSQNMRIQPTQMNQMCSLTHLVYWPNFTRSESPPCTTNKTHIGAMERDLPYGNRIIHHLTQVNAPCLHPQFTSPNG